MKCSRNILVALTCICMVSVAHADESCEQFIKTIQNLNQKAEYCLTFLEELKLILSDSDLEKKKTRYIADLIRVYRKHNMEPCPTSVELEKSRENIYIKLHHKYRYLMMINGAQMMQLEAWALFKEAVFENAVSLIVVKCDEVVKSQSLEY